MEKKTKNKNSARKPERKYLKYPAFSKRHNLRIRQEELNDFDYLDKLSEKEKEWMNKFLEEYVNDDFRHSGKKLHTGKLKTDCHSRNNLRNKDALSTGRAYKKMVDFSSMDTETTNPDYEMDKLIFEYDKKMGKKE